MLRWHETGAHECLPTYPNEYWTPATLELLSTISHLTPHIGAQSCSSLQKWRQRNDLFGRNRTEVTDRNAFHQTFSPATHTHMHSCNKWIEYPATAWDNSLCRIKIFSKHHRYDGAQTTCLRNGKPIFHFNPSYSSISNKRVRRQRKMMQMFLYRRIVLLEMPVALCWNGLRRTPRKGSKRTLQESRTHTHTPRTLALIETLQRGGSKKWKLGLVLSDLARQAGLQGKRTGLDPAMWCLVGAIIAAVCP